MDLDSFLACCCAENTDQYEANIQAMSKATVVKEGITNVMSFLNSCTQPQTVEPPLRLRFPTEEKKTVPPLPALPVAPAPATPCLQNDQVVVENSDNSLIFHNNNWKEPEESKENIISSIRSSRAKKSSTKNLGDTIPLPARSIPNPSEQMLLREETKNISLSVGITEPIKDTSNKGMSALLLGTTDCTLKPNDLKRLFIEIVEGASELKGQVLEISTIGLVNSIRKTQEGVVYFGNTDSKPVLELINYYTLPESESGLGNRHFKIFYSRHEDEFKIKDLGEGTGTFVRIDDRFQVKDGTMVSFGNYNALLNFKNTLDLFKEDTVKITIAECAEAKAKYSFTAKNSPVTIGRGVGCDIRLKSTALSRVQCRLMHVERKWYVYDGDGTRPSTNGTWVYAEEPTKLVDGAVFKAGKLVFRARVVGGKYAEAHSTLLEK